MSHDKTSLMSYERRNSKNFDLTPFEEIDKENSDFEEDEDSTENTNPFEINGKTYEPGFTLPKKNKVITPTSKTSGRRRSKRDILAEKRRKSSKQNSFSPTNINNTNTSNNNSGSTSSSTGKKARDEISLLDDFLFGNNYNNNNNSNNNNNNLGPDLNSFFELNTNNNHSNKNSNNNNNTNQNDDPFADFDNLFEGGNNNNNTNNPFAFIENNNNNNEMKSPSNNSENVEDDSDNEDSELSDLDDNTLNRNSNKIKNNKKRHTAPAGQFHDDLGLFSKDEEIKERKIGVNTNDKSATNRIKSDLKNNKSPKSTSNNNNKNNTNKNIKKPEKKAPSKPKKLYDALPELKRGTALLKYGKRGYPHFRQFNLSRDNDSIIWFSNKKKMSQSEIKVKDIDEVVTGQHTKEFRRIAWTTLTPASFSVIYDKRKKSLNLVAKSVDEMKMWVNSLRQLKELYKKGENLAKLRHLKIDIDFRDRNRPQSRKHAGQFLRSHETKEKEVDPILHRKLIDDVKQLKKTFNDIAALANNQVIRESHECDSITQILSELEERIEELQHEIKNTRNTKIAENDVWRTRIDMEALREKIKVIKKHNKKKKRRFSVF